jgi:hypothetical protein
MEKTKTHVNHIAERTHKLLTQPVENPLCTVYFSRTLRDGMGWDGLQCTADLYMGEVVRVSVYEHRTMTCTGPASNECHSGELDPDAR